MQKRYTYVHVHSGKCDVIVHRFHVIHRILVSTEHSPRLRSSLIEPIQPFSDGRRQDESRTHDRRAARAVRELPRARGRREEEAEG